MRRISFKEELVTDVVEVPTPSHELLGELFYSQQDYEAFQMAEQKRYDKRMAKHIQQLVRDAMAPKIQLALDNGATPDEIEAMMPQTTEAIFELIGSDFTKTLPKPPPPVNLHTSNETTTTTTTTTLSTEITTTEIETTTTRTSVGEHPECLGENDDHKLLAMDETFQQQQQPQQQHDPLPPSTTNDGTSRKRVPQEDASPRQDHNDDDYDSFPADHNNDTAKNTVSAIKNDNGKKQKDESSPSPFSVAATTASDKMDEDVPLPKEEDETPFQIVDENNNNNHNNQDEQDHELDIMDALERDKNNNYNNHEKAIMEEGGHDHDHDSKSINSVLGTSFSSQVSIEDLLPETTTSKKPTTITMERE